MLVVSKPSPNRVDIELSGALNTKEMRNGLESLFDQTETVSGAKVLYVIKDFEMPTLGALAVEFQQMPKLFGLIGKFEKCAVVTDTAWIRTAAELEGAVIPSLEIRSFPAAAIQQAKDWLEKSDDPDNTEDEQLDNVPV